MKISHHPDSATVVSYAAGTLEEAFATVVSAHLMACAECRARLCELEEVGGALLEGIPAESMDQAAVLLALSRLDEPAAEQVEEKDVISEPLVSHPVARLIGSSLDDVEWRTLAPGVSIHRLPISRGSRGSLLLLKIAPGKKMPEHGHGGSEITLILRGSYKDALGRFGPGDVADLDEDIEHQPVVDSSEPCICLVATEAPTRFKSFLGRLLQPLVKI